MPILCLWPPLSLMPRSPTISLYPLTLLSMYSAIWAFLAASRTRTKSILFSGIPSAMFWAIEQSAKYIFWGTCAIKDRQLSIESILDGLWILSLSTNIFPFDGSKRPIIKSTSVLLPLPVFPINPILSPLLIVNSIDFNTKGVSLLYLNETESRTIFFLKEKSFFIWLIRGVDWFNKSKTVTKAALEPLIIAHELYICWRTGSNLWEPNATAPRIGKIDDCGLFVTRKVANKAIDNIPKASKAYLGKIPKNWLLAEFMRCFMSAVL